MNVGLLPMGLSQQIYYSREARSLRAGHKAPVIGHANIMARSLKALYPAAAKADLSEAARVHSYSPQKNT
jgi:hypothetical protein